VVKAIRSLHKHKHKHANQTCNANQVELNCNVPSMETRCVCAEACKEIPFKASRPRTFDGAVLAAGVSSFVENAARACLCKSCLLCKERPTLNIVSAPRYCVYIFRYESYTEFKLKVNRKNKIK